MTYWDRGLLMGLEGGGDRLEWIGLCEYDKVEDFLYNPSNKKASREHPDFAKILDCKLTIQVGTTQL
ncbi:MULTISPECIES: hypothetical protein [unclassified Microcoleus]|uniref:hypothetical protein n=1 Tax=unclassified Microcoleus TaxID=2642155 RepID=UPI002FD107C1